MATQIDDIDDQDNQDLDENEEQQDAGDGEQGNEPDGDETEGEDDDDVISFAGARVADEDEPEGMRNLRTAYREERRKREELEAKIAPPVEQVGPEPTLDDEDVQWDEAAFKAKYAKWTADKAKADQAGAAQRQQAEAAQKEWQDDLATYETQKASLKVRDYDAAEDRVVSSLSETQHALLIQASNNKAALKYALGKNPEKLADLAKITNPVKFTAAVARLDMETTVQKRRPTTQPESAVRGSAGFTKGGDKKLERLEREAAASNDRTELIAYKRELRKAGK
jgi:hypothetical protein